jgi:ribonuclease HI
MITKLYCDGACSCNFTGMGYGGYAAMVFENSSCVATISGHRCKTTNNRMELTAAIMGMRKSLSLDGGPHIIEIMTDSQYLSNGFEKIPARDPDWFEKAINGDLWKMLARYSTRFMKSKCTWIRGHANDHTHNQVDRLARAEARKCRRQCE